MRLAAAILVLHAAAALSVLAVMRGPAGALLALALLALGAAAAWSRALLRSARSIRAIELEGDAIHLILTNGARLPAEPGEGRFVTAWMVAVPLRRPRRTLLVTGDMLAADPFRRLRIWALWRKLPPARQGVAAAQLAA